MLRLSLFQKLLKRLYKVKKIKNMWKRLKFNFYYENRWTQYAKYRHFYFLPAISITWDTQFKNEELLMDEACSELTFYFEWFHMMFSFVVNIKDK